jgi:hypothetical protein
VCSESPGTPAVTIGWKQALGGGAVKASTELLTAQLTNNTKANQQGKIVASASGLDGRLVERTLGAFNLAAGATKDVSLPISGLPVQSQGSLSFARLQVEIAGPVGPVRPASTSLLYYIFDNNYTQAELYTSNEASNLPNGGLRATDPMDVRGRTIDAQGAVQEISSASATPSNAPRQGLAGINMAPSKLTSYPSSGVPRLATSRAYSGAQPLADVSTNLHLYWRVYYNDQGFGEDVWNYWTHIYANASYSYLEISDTSFQNYYYWNYLDNSGSTGNVALPANTTLYATIYMFAEDPNGTHFNNWLNIDGIQYIMTYTMGFSTGYGGNKNLIVPYGSEVFQTSALADLILKQENDSPGSRGIVPGSVFDLFSNTACPGASGNLSSCYWDTVNGHALIYYGTQSGGNLTAGSSWKYLIAHEIGHAVQDVAMGVAGDPGNHYEDVVDQGHRRCRCDSVETETRHCLNSKEEWNVGAVEGFGHFYGDKIFNNDTQGNATFVYYKEFQNSDTPSDYTNPPMAKDGFGATSHPDNKWNDLKCTPNGAFVTSVEYDLMRFFYNVGSSDSGSGGPSTRTTINQMFDIYKAACGGSGSPAKCNSFNSPSVSFNFNNLYYAAQSYYGPGDPRFTRFSRTANNEGAVQ